MARKIIFTKKQAAQYAKLEKKFTISKREFLNFYEDLRKANRKVQRLKSLSKSGRESASALREVEYSTSTKALSSNIVTREDFLKYRRSVRNVLKREWRTSENLRIRERTNTNLREIFEGTKVNSFIDYLNNLSDSETDSFWKANEDIKRLRWASPEKAKKAAKFLAETADKFEERVIRFEAEKAGISFEKATEAIKAFEKEEGVAAELTDLRDIFKAL